MSKFTKESLKNHMIGGIVVAVAGGIMAITARSIYKPEVFFECYIKALEVVGYLAIVCGLIWFALAFLHSGTSFFDLDEKIEADKAILGLVIIGIVTITLCYYFVGKMPVTPPNKISPEPGAREAVLKREREDRRYVVASTMTVGLIFAVFPAIRFYRSTRKTGKS